jgi:hypothetical protein
MIEGRNFDLYVIGVDGTGLRRITFNVTFDGFQCFSRDGKSWCSPQTDSAKQGDTNVFIADWIE